MIVRLEAVIARAADSYRPDGRFLAVLRMAYGLWILLLPVDILWIAAVPNEFVNPRPGLFGFMDSVPPEGTLIALTVIRAVLAVLLAVGILTLPVSILMTAVLMTAAGISYSFSKVDHFILFELVPLFLVFAGWGHRWSFDAWWRARQSRPFLATRGMPVLLYAMTIGWAMLSAAVPKVMGGWLDPSRQATRGYIARDIAIGEKLGPLGEWLLPLDIDLFWKLLDYATIAAEGLLIVFVLTPTIYRLWIVLLAFFHTGVYLTLGISFIDYTMVYAVFFSPVVMWAVHRARRSRQTPIDASRHA
ncbi:hypothetical protein [Microbacterium enclense]|uniref:hypothetical protein n=1 Tax=Microbacterium enclense TaxID=993073 RepID=UPI003D70AB95